MLPEAAAIERVIMWFGLLCLFFIGWGLFEHAPQETHISWYVGFVIAVALDLLIRWSFGKRLLCPKCKLHQRVGGKLFAA
jgi:hypothetical protein